MRATRRFVISYYESFLFISFIYLLSAVLPFMLSPSQEQEKEAEKKEEKKKRK